MKTEFDFDKKFDFDKIGKREPYSVPAGFYETLGREIVANAGIHRKKSPVWRWVITAVTSAAAVAAIMTVFVMPQKNYAANAPCSLEDVELSFGRLQSDDRDYLLETYEEDIFLTQTTIEE